MSSDGGTMRALTIRQPWASLIALGVKTIETRSWQTHYRGPLLIHAGKAEPGPIVLGSWEVGRLDVGADRRMWRIDEFGPPVDLPLGAVVAVATLTDCVEIRDEAIGEPQGRLGWFRMVGGKKEMFADATDQIPYGDFTPGRWAWLLDDVQPIDPIPAKGRQGLWTPDAQMITTEAPDEQ